MSSPSSSAIYDGVFPSLEQEAPDIADPRRAVEVFTDNGVAYLRLGPVEGLDAVHGNYTVRLSRDDATALIDALRSAAAPGV